MQASDYQEHVLELAGWPVNISSYRLGVEWYSKADNYSPGASLARSKGATREEAEQRTIERAAELLGRTRRPEL